MMLMQPARTFSFVYSGAHPLFVFSLLLRNSLAAFCIKKKIWRILKQLSAKNEEIAFVWLERDFLFYNPLLNSNQIFTNIKIRINRLQERKIRRRINTPYPGDN